MKNSRARRKEERGGGCLVVVVVVMGVDAAEKSGKSP
jgi:hypothetical protein